MEEWPCTFLEMCQTGVVSHGDIVENKGINAGTDRNKVVISGRVVYNAGTGECHIIVKEHVRKGSFTTERILTFPSPHQLLTEAKERGKASKKRVDGKAGNPGYPSTTWVYITDWSTYPRTFGELKRECCQKLGRPPNFVKDESAKKAKKVKKDVKEEDDDSSPAASSTPPPRKPRQRKNPRSPTHSRQPAKKKKRKTPSCPPSSPVEMPLDPNLRLGDFEEPNSPTVPTWTAKEQRALEAEGVALEVETAKMGQIVMGTFYEGTGPSLLRSDLEGGGLPSNAKVASHITHHGCLSGQDGFYKADMDHAKPSETQTIEAFDDAFMTNAFFDQLSTAAIKDSGYGLTDPVAPIPRLPFGSTQVFLSAGGQ